MGAHWKVRFFGLFTKNQHIGGNCSKREGGGGGASRGLGEIGWMVLLKEGGWYPNAHYNKWFDKTGEDSHNVENELECQIQ